MKQQPRRKAPILIIDVLELGHQSSTINLIRPGYPERKVKPSLGYGNLAEYYEHYHEGLENFKQELQSDNLKQDFKLLTKAFKTIFKTGKVLFEHLFEDSTPDVINYLRNHIIAGFGLKNFPYPQVGVIEVRTNNIKDIIPVECLVMIGSKPEVASFPDMTRAASGLLGFSFVVNRVIKTTRQSQKRELNNVPKLPLKYFYDKSLKDTNIELAFFRKNKKHFNLDGPWPEEHVEAIEEALVRYLFLPEVGFSQIEKTMERQPDEIHHLSCHCYTDEEYSWKYNLRLTGSWPITLETMEAHLSDLRYSGSENRTQVEMPLVFLNACGSSKLTPKGITSFPEYFLDRNRNCGFIGSEINVPDSFAAKFCEQFYLHLIRGFGAGEAILMARRKMLERYNNPLGILYTSYVDPYLRVTKAVNNA